MFRSRSLLLLRMKVWLCCVACSFIGGMLLHRDRREGPEGPRWLPWSCIEDWRSPTTTRRRMQSSFDLTRL
ncbi:hypothetical protein P171DRAFT_100749 [Karstenula rhodostoma CBS 690.94]|uniref:Uncharacterized protein n=1 Tax=Karstenula rhodostoma CBS 690.94 TaxID=1392251 RepID=A0A9P4U6R8_9PLEO|nr:hypothetical protein P171DRAFT_100749 [Karstenula rhodostoma CBS 690.94]